MYHEASRLMSFFGITMRPSHIHMAAAGFYATGIGDETMCFSCGIRYRNWLFGHRPQDVGHMPWCLHKQGSEPRNVTFQTKPLPVDCATPCLRPTYGVVLEENDRYQDSPDISLTLIARGRLTGVPCLTPLPIGNQSVELPLLETHVSDGVLILKICSYRRQKQEAISGHTSYLYSQPFYTSTNGYKMCARIYLNGDGIGKSTHLSLFLVIMRGEDDSLLQWPFQQNVGMYLLDQGDEQRHLGERFHPDPSSSNSFRRPQTEMNIGSGCPLFVSHSALENPTNKYLKDDTIFIKVVVETTNS